MVILSFDQRRGKCYIYCILSIKHMEEDYSYQKKDSIEVSYFYVCGEPSQLSVQSAMRTAIYRDQRRDAIYRDQRGPEAIFMLDSYCLNPPTK